MATFPLIRVKSAWTIEPLTPPTTPRLFVTFTRTRSNSTSSPPAAPAPVNETFASSVLSVKVTVVVITVAGWLTPTAPPIFPA